MQVDKNILNEFDSTMKAYCFPMYERLIQPLEPGEIINIFNTLGLSDPVLLELYKWRNGIPNQEDLPTNAFRIFPFGVFPPLNDVLQFQELGVSEECWKKSLISIVASYSGDFLLYESSRKSENYGMLFLYSPNLGYVEDVISYYDSVETMLLTIIQCFYEDALNYINIESGLNIDWDMYFEISSKLNPKSDYWKNG